MELKEIPIKKPPDINVILGQSHFIKTVEDVYEVMMHVPGARFGLAFCEASGPCLVRAEGNDPELQQMAVDNALAIGAGHSFIVFMKNCFPISALNAIKNVPEVCRIFCATANPTTVLVAESSIDGETGRGIVGVVDGFMPQGVESPEDVEERQTFLRTIGYKR